MNSPESQEHYLQGKGQFHPDLIKHFPKKLPNNQIGFGFSFHNEGRIPGSGYLITKHFSRESYFNTKDKYESEAQFHVKSTDDCLFVVSWRKWTNRVCDRNYPVSINAICQADDIDANPQLMANAEVMILAVEKGDFIKEGSDTLDIDLPFNFPKGYSSGVTANDKEKTIVFWFVIW